MRYDCMVIGAGPAGLAAALEVNRAGRSVLLVERESRLGGILKQCIHDGFGLIKFKEQLTGPEYAQRYIDEVMSKDIDIALKAYVTAIKSNGDGFLIHLVDREKGIRAIETKTVILATGCRERTSKQLFIGGSRPSGIYTAGTAQYLVNIDGLLPCKNCVILGSGDIGLIMARRLTLEGANVIGVFEAKPEPSGLARNIEQCLNDFNIPLHLSSTVISVHGDERIQSVVTAKLNLAMEVIEGTEETIACDGLILSVGLIPENEIAENLGAIIDPKTRGPFVNEKLMTSVPGVFSCGNALHVFDLVDHVSVSGERAGRSAATYLDLEEA